MSEGITIEGAEEFIGKLAPSLLVRPLRRLLQRAAIYTQGEARELAPVDTGRLRSSLDYEIDENDPPLWAKVGTSVFYAPYQEYGTGAFAEGDTGLGASLGSIGGPARGGIRPKRYLRGALQKLLGELPALLSQFFTDVADEWSR